MRRQKATRSGLVQHELLRIEGRPVDVTVRFNPRARRLIVKVHPSTGEVCVVAPSKRALASALDFARGEEAWIARRLAEVPGAIALAPGNRIPLLGKDYAIREGRGGPAPVWIEDDLLLVSGRPEHAQRRIVDFLKREARRALEPRTVEFAARIGAKPKKISIGEMASRWGSCSATQCVSYSWRLVLAPPFVLDYVIAHEVAHLREMNHGPRFWKLVLTLVDDVRRPQTWLRNNGVSLHRYGA